MYKVVTFYKFQNIDDPKALKAELEAICKGPEGERIKGTILVAKEGINSTVAGLESDIDQLVSFLDARFQNMPYKFSTASKMPFYRLKVRIKEEIVTLRKETKPGELTAEYVTPQDWNKLIADPEVVVIDVRNDYECKVGTFKNAINPKTDSFTEFADYIEKNLMDKKDKKIAMCCTGGIRVEKASSYMKLLGFDHLYQLHGGILKYLEEIPAEESLWEGECFVFDQRVTVEHKVEEGHFKLCCGCRNPLSDADMQSDTYEKGVSCPNCFSNTTEEQKKRFRDRQMQIALAAARGECHMGPRA